MDVVTVCVSDYYDVSKRICYVVPDNRCRHGKPCLLINENDLGDLCLHLTDVIF